MRGQLRLFTCRICNREKIALGGFLSQLFKSLVILGHVKDEFLGSFPIFFL